MTTQTEVLKLALEALGVATTPLAKDRQEVLRAIAAIKEALSSPNGEAQPEPEQEPVAIMREMLEVQGQHGNWNYDSYMHGLYNGMEYMVALAEKREPKFRDAPDKWLAKYEVKRDNFNSTEQLTEATPPQREPLTDGQFMKIKASLSTRDPSWDGDAWDFALKEAIEEFHGIKE